MMALSASAAMTSTAAAAGLCSLANHGYYQIYVTKTTSVSGGFDLARGTASVANLDICVGSSSGQGGSFVLPANIQRTDGLIVQLGYGKWAGRTDQFFVWTPNGDGAAVEWTAGGWKPITGHKYRFSIERVFVSGTPKLMYTIEDLNVPGSRVDAFGINVVSLSQAWWGYETWDSYSAHGHLASDSQHVDMKSLYYRVSGGGTTQYTNITTVFNNSGQSNHHGHLILSNTGLDGETH